MDKNESTLDATKPKILFIASNIPTPKRKSNRVVMTIAHKLSQGFKISVMHPSEFAPFPINLLNKYKTIVGKQSWEDDGITVRPFKYIRLFGKKNAFLLLPLYKKRIKQYIERFGIPDLVHAHFALPDGYFAYLIHKKLQVPFIISFRKSDMKLLNQSQSSNTVKLMKETLSNAKQIIVHNAAQQEALSTLGFKSILMAHGIEENFVKPKEALNNSNRITIVSIGELIEQKRIDWVIKAVTDYSGSKDLTLKIAGEGPMHQAWKSLIGEKKNITFLGQISHDKINELLQQSDIFALPSYNETFGLVYLEAAAHQNAVIATKGTGIWGHFKESEEMLYCDSYDSFQKKLYALIDDDEFRYQMAKNAFERTSTHFTWDKVIEKYVSAYTSFLN